MLCGNVLKSFPAALIIKERCGGGDIWTKERVGRARCLRWVGTVVGAGFVSGTGTFAVFRQLSPLLGLYGRAVVFCGLFSLCAAREKIRRLRGGDEGCVREICAVREGGGAVRLLPFPARGCCPLPTRCCRGRFLSCPSPFSPSPVSSPSGACAESARSI